MAISKRKMDKLSRLLTEAERLSAEICKSRGMKAPMESKALITHGAILKANAAFGDMNHHAQTLALQKGRRALAKFNASKLTPENLEVEDETNL